MENITNIWKIQKFEKYTNRGMEEKSGIKTKIATDNETSNKKKRLVCKNVNFQVRKRLVKCYIWSIFF